MIAKTSFFEKNLLLILFMPLYVELKIDNIFFLKKNNVHVCVHHIVRVGKRDYIVILQIWRLEKLHLNHLFPDFFFPPQTEEEKDGDIIQN